MKVYIYLNIFGGCLDEVVVFSKEDDALSYFEKHFPNCGGYDRYREWLELANGAIEVDGYARREELEILHPGLKDLDRDTTDCQILSDSIITGEE